MVKPKNATHLRFDGESISLSLLPNVGRPPPSSPSSVSITVCSGDTSVMLNGTPVAAIETAGDAGLKAPGEVGNVGVGTLSASLSSGLPPPLLLGTGVPPPPPSPPPLLSRLPPLRDREGELESKPACMRSALYPTGGGARL